jgi:hypothetical protein
MADGAASRGQNFHELELIEFIKELLKLLEFREVRIEDSIARGARVDLSASRDGVIFLIEVKKDAPQTEKRIDQEIGQLRRYEHEAQRGFYEGRTIRLVLATPGFLSPRARERLGEEGIELWDGRWILGHAQNFGLHEDAARFIPAGILSRDPRAERAAAVKSISFSARLTGTQPGKPSWSDYQRLCKDIFEYLFCPPLETPIWESENWSGVNRRDMIFPNYAGEGIWKFLRDTYRADLVVIDAKNYKGQIKKVPVLQMAHYLTRHGTGLFGLIASRTGSDPSALYMLREQWVLHDKMILVLSDADILQMLEVKAAGDDPATLIRQKIEDFRTSM